MNNEIIHCFWVSLIWLVLRKTDTTDKFSCTEKSSTNYRIWLSIYFQKKKKKIWRHIWIIQTRNIFNLELVRLKKKKSLLPFIFMCIALILGDSPSMKDGKLHIVQRQLMLPTLGIIMVGRWARL